MTGLWIAIGAGILLAGGMWALGGYFVRPHPRLEDALRLLDGQGQEPAAAAEGATGVDRLGRWLRLLVRGGVDDRISRQLRLRGIGLDRFYTYKLLAGAAGLALPGLVAAVLLLVTNVSVVLPLLVALLLGVVGFFVPDIVLGRGAKATSSDATEALLTFMDLVTLERLANSSATQSLHAAAAISDHGVFLAIRASLQRSRLEQRAPYADLKRLGAELELPALCDIADVMRLDDSGASLSDALRARVKELRDAHLTKARIEAASISERMTFLMVIPSLIFGLLFLTPPLLRILGS